MRTIHPCHLILRGLLTSFLGADSFLRYFDRSYVFPSEVCIPKSCAINSTIDVPSPDLWKPHWLSAGGQWLILVSYLNTKRYWCTCSNEFLCWTPHCTVLTMSFQLVERSVQFVRYCRKPKGRFQDSNFRKSPRLSSQYSSRQQSTKPLSRYKTPALLTFGT